VSKSSNARFDLGVGETDLATKHMFVRVRKVNVGHQAGSRDCVDGLW
jgi:hypothetical protein